MLFLFNVFVVEAGNSHLVQTTSKKCIFRAVVRLLSDCNYFLRKIFITKN